MSDHKPEKPIDLGVYGRSADRSDQAVSFGGTELLAGALTLVWLGLSLAVHTQADSAAPQHQGGLSMLLTAVAIVAPVMLIWIAALTLRSLRALKAETAQLREAVTALRQAQLALQQSANVTRRPLPESDPADRPADNAARATMSATGPARQAPRPTPRPAEPVPATGDGQAQLALETGPGPEAEQVPAAELILALNFPDDAEDVAAIAALKRALRDRDSAKLIRAAQDVLTLLGNDGIYMDMFQPDRARPEVWRRFAGGERGRGIAALGGIRDREILAAITARMRQDPVFRDAAHHFLRSFDRYFSTFADRAEDAAISAFAETRTAKAFMLIGRVTGTFD
jgi:hypothetical protein